MIQHRKFDRARLQGKYVLDIGCGRKKLAGAIGLDQRAHEGVDIVADLNQRLPIDDASYDIVHADQVLEHIPNLIGLIHEIHRILKPGGSLVAHVPYFRSSWAHIDPTHVRSFTINTLDYFVAGTFCNRDYSFGDATFASHEVYLDTDYRSTPARALFTALALRWPFRFENSTLACLFPFEQLTYVLTK
jgi:SAM-dependent methyltransferase